jgi:TonB family protein
MIANFAHAALAICAAVVGSLWEGIPIVAAVWLALRVLPNLGAATRYVVWLCALAALLVVPVVTVWMTAPHVDNATTTDTARAVTLQIAAPREVHPTNHVTTVARETATEEAPVPGQAAPQPSVQPRIDVPQAFAIAVAMLWFLAASVRALLLLQDLRELSALRRGAERRSNADGYPIFVSNTIRVPLAVGFLHPAVILPAPLHEELSQTEVNAVVAHEVAHLRRLDVWTNALARVIEIFVVLNPLAWLVVRRLSIEREIACDDWVVARSGGGETFARTLATLASRTCARTPLAAPSALGSRHAVVERIERLLDARPRRLRPSLAALGAVLAFIAIAAFVLQSVSPVFAYAPTTVATSKALGSVVAAGTCPVPNRPIQLSGSMGFRIRGPVRYYPVEDATKIVARFTQANVAIVDLTVDASGTPHVAVVSTPPYAGLADYVSNIFTHDKYEPALQNCVAVTSTVRTGLRVAKPQENSMSIVSPSYPDGWSAAHPTACKVPPVLHTGVPAFPSAMSGFSVMASAKVSARVSVDASGTVTNATILKSSNQPAFDSALLQAAQSENYPLLENTGFKPVRPSNATLAWNAANGSAAYSKCTPKPGAYVWNTTFKPIVPIGAPGASLDVVVMGMNF